MASIDPKIENSLKMHENQHSGMAIEFGRTHTTPLSERLQSFFYNHQKFTMAKPKQNLTKQAIFDLVNSQNQNKKINFFCNSLITDLIPLFSTLFPYFVFVVKKSGGFIIAGLLLALGIAGPIGLKALAVIAGKALIISKIALTIAGIIALKKIFSSHPDGRSFNDVLTMPTMTLEDVDIMPNQNNDPYRSHHRAFRH